MPPPNPQCTTLEHFAIVQATFNISSDVLIIAIPVPMLVSLSLPTKQKIGLGVLFSMGTFVVRFELKVPQLCYLLIQRLDHRCNSDQGLQSV